MSNVRLLVVDDEDINRQTLRYCLEPVGFQIDEAGDGVEAWHALSQGRSIYDAILLDRRMPEMDGMELLAKIKAEDGLRDIPVVMQTAMDSEQEIIDGIEAGVYYYLTKPYDVDVLVSVVRSATEEYARHCRIQSELAKRSGAVRLMTSGRFELRTPKEADALAVLLASSLPRSSAVAMGFSELLINAIEHGNLEIDYEKKTELIAEGEWEDAIQNRLDQPPFRDRRVTVDVARNTAEARFTITDEGTGFDWQAYMDLTMDRVFDTHGRGIAMARKLSFSTLAYKGRGNVVEVSIELEPPAALSCVTIDDGVEASVRERLSSVTGWPAAEEGRSLTVSAETSAGGSGTRLIHNGFEAGTLDIPSDLDLAECIARCLLLPDSMELGTAEELRLAPALAQFQSSLPPDPADLAAGAIVTKAWCRPCTSVNGDTWGGRILADGRLVVFVADMTGHGPVAGLNTLRLWSVLDKIEEAAPADEVLRHLDGSFKEALPSGQYAAMLYGILDPSSGRFDYAAAGVPHPMSFDAAGHHVASGSGKGMPVGASGVFPYELRSLDVPQGGTLMLCTDGLFALLDADHKKADAFERFLAAMEAQEDDTTATSRLDALIAEHAGDALVDDLTAVCVALNRE